MTKIFLSFIMTIPLDGAGPPFKQAKKNPHSKVLYGMHLVDIGTSNSGEEVKYVKYLQVDREANGYTDANQNQKKQNQILSMRTKQTKI